MGTKIRIDCVMRPRSSSRGRNTSALVTVTVIATTVLFCQHLKLMSLLIIYALIDAN